MTMIMLLFLCIGVLAGIVGSLAGMGGGIFFVPALLYVANIYEPGTMTPQLAAGTSLLVIAVTALSSTLAYIKQKKVDIQAAWLFFLGSAPGSITGVYFNKLLDAATFSLIFGIFQLLMFVLLLIKDRLKPLSIRLDVQRSYREADGTEHQYGYNRWLAVVLAFFVGNVSSLFGVGGGILMVPILLILFRFPPHMATATSMFVIFLSACTGSITNLLHHQISWFYVLPLAPGAWLGGLLGAKIAARMKGKTLIVFLRVLILILAIQMIVESFLE